MVNRASVNANAVNGSVGAVAIGTGAAALTLRQEVRGLVGRPVIALAQVTTTLGRAALTLRQEVRYPTEAVALALRQEVRGTGAAALGLTITRLDTAERGQRWRLGCRIDGVDVSGRLTGECRIEAEEGAARLCEFTLRVPPGPFAEAHYLGAPVAIDYLPLDASGEPMGAVPMFRGRLDQPTLDAESGELAVVGSDGRQDRLAALTRERIDALTPGAYYSDYVDDPEAEGTDYADIRMASLPAALDLDVPGGWRLTPWAAGAPRYSLGVSEIVHGSVDMVLAPRDSLVNRVLLEVEYRYRRDVERRVKVQWAYPLNFCAGLPYTKPDDDMIRRALEGTGWQVPAVIHHRRLPPSGVIFCGGRQINWIISEPLRQQLSLGFGATLTRRYTRYATERFTLDVRSPGSAGEYGEVLRRRRAGFAAGDPLDWDETVAVERWDGEDAVDRWINRHDADAGRAAADEAIAGLIARAEREILAAHRAHAVRCTTPILPHLDCNATISIEHPSVAATGKLRRVTHRFDTGSGRAVSELEVAVSRSSPAEVGDPVQPPPPASFARAAEALQLRLPTRFGGEPTSPPYNPEWQGYTGMWSQSVVFEQAVEEDLREVEADAAGEVYPQRMRITMPTIEREPLAADAAATHTVGIPHDPLTITVPEESTWP